MEHRKHSVLLSNVRSMKDLHRACDVNIRMDQPISLLYRKADSWFQQARTYESESDLIPAYIIFARIEITYFLSLHFNDQIFRLSIHELPKHRDFESKGFDRSRALSKQNALKALQSLERLRPTMVQEIELLELARKGREDRERIRKENEDLYLEKARKQKEELYREQAEQRASHKAKNDKVSLWLAEQVNYSEQNMLYNPSQVQSTQNDVYSSQNLESDEWWKVDTKKPTDIISISSSTTLQNPSRPQLKFSSLESVPPAIPPKPSNSLNNDGSFGLVPSPPEYKASHPLQTQQEQQFNYQQYSQLNQNNLSYPQPNRYLDIYNHAPQQYLRVTSVPQQISQNLIPPRLESSSQSVSPIANSKLAPPIPNKPDSIKALLGSLNDVTQSIILYKQDTYAAAEDGQPLRQVDIPGTLIPMFIDIAKQNTLKNIETCGILSGILRNDMFVITTLLIPKQRGTSDSTETMNEEEIFEYQSTRDLLTLGWIHTHPSQTCFMSSIDLHTHCSYQQLLPEAIAIVVSPNHSPRWGVFRLTSPEGLDVVLSCPTANKHHPHPDGVTLYRGATREDVEDGLHGHVRMAGGVGALKVVDLRL
ncbi:hypothetical protein HK096_002235 [Nowakowskiella sp. JEL0078]|nr:hypothetical protein HK096_002235 [Nowakowskiella sp. JEL0078]